MQVIVSFCCCNLAASRKNSYAIMKHREREVFAVRKVIPVLFLRLNKTEIISKTFFSTIIYLRT